MKKWPILVLYLISYAYGTYIHPQTIAVFFDFEQLIEEPVRQKSIRQAFKPKNAHELIEFLFAFAWQNPQKAVSLVTHLNTVLEIIKAEQVSEAPWLNQLNRIISELKDRAIVDLKPYIKHISKVTSTISLNTEIMHLLNQLKTVDCIELDIITKYNQEEFQTYMHMLDPLHTELYNSFKKHITFWQEDKNGDHYMQGFIDYGNNEFGMLHQKPHPNIFRSLKKIADDAHAIIVIDSDQAVVDAARTAHMIGIQYSSPQQLKKDLNCVLALYGVTIA